MGIERSHREGVMGPSPEYPPKELYACGLGGSQEGMDRGYRLSRIRDRKFHLSSHREVITLPEFRSSVRLL